MRSRSNFMATNDELAARYPDLMGDMPEADRELIETVRALDALYAAPAPARLNIPMAWPANWQATTTQAGVTGTAPLPMRSRRREADGMRVLRTADSKRWTGIAAAAAACLVVGLLAALLIGGHGGFGGTPSPGNNSIFGQQSSLSINALTGCTEPACSLVPVMQKETSVLTQRLSGVSGVRSVTITPVSASELNIKLVGITDLSAVASLLAAGTFEILDTGGQYLAPGASVAGQTCTTACASGQYKIVFTGSQLDPNQISAGLDTQTGQPIVTFAFAGSARQAFAQYTAQHIGQYLTIALDGTVIESATIQSEIDGNGQITGFASAARARQVAVLLKSGPLPEPFQMLLVQACPQQGPITPAPTATEPPNAPTPLPTYTPWPSSTPIGAPTATPLPPAGPGYLAPYPPAVIYECGTATPGPIGTAFPAGTPPPNGTPVPTPVQGGTSTPTPLPIPPTPTPIPTATPA
jgi:hypothetical protein